jgi:hypothetical protein
MPSDGLVEAVTDWINRCTAFGPPWDGVRVWPEPDPDDLYAAAVRDTELTVTYRVVEFERLIILRDLGQDE